MQVGIYVQLRYPSKNSIFQAVKNVYCPYSTRIKSVADIHKYIFCGEVLCRIEKFL